MSDGWLGTCRLGHGRLLFSAGFAAKHLCTVSSNASRRQLVGTARFGGMERLLTWVPECAAGTWSANCASSTKVISTFRIALRIVQPKGRSHSFHQLVFVVVVVGGLIGRRPAWSQTGLLTAGLATEGAPPHQAPSLAPQPDISWYSMPGCRVFTQGSSPAQFRTSSCSVSLPMSVDEPACIFVFLLPVLLGGRMSILLPPGLFTPRVTPTLSISLFLLLLL